MKTAEERYEETWNSYLELLNKDPRASLKVLLVQKGEEEEKTKRALKVLGKLNRNKSEKQTPPAQETETPATTIIQQRKSLMAKRRDRTPTTAHGLLAKTENLFEKLNEALKMTVKTGSTA